MSLVFDQTHAKYVAKSLSQGLTFVCVVLVVLGVYILPTIVVAMFRDVRSALPPIIVTIQWIVALLFSIITAVIVEQTAEDIRHRFLCKLDKNITVVAVGWFVVIWLIQSAASVAFVLDWIDFHQWVAFFPWSFVAMIAVHILSWIIFGVLRSCFVWKEEENGATDDNPDV